MSQYHSMDTSIDHSMMFDGDISILPSDIDQIHDQNTPTSTQIEEKENTPFRDVSADLVFSRSISSSNRKFRLPKTYTNVNKLNKLLFKDHKLLIKPIVTSSDQIVEIIKDKCKIWKVINDKNINDRIMSLDVPFITNALVKEYQKNVFFEKQTALTTLKKTRGKNLTQFEYNLLMHNILTSENLLLHNFTTPKNRNVKLQSLQTTYKRFFDPKTKRIVVVHQKTFKEVIPPFLLMETILHIHLINNHMKLETLYRNLVQKFCNTTRQSVVSALQSCSICRRDDVDDSEPEETLPTASEERTSMETVQADVYELSDHKQVLVLKDLHSQYVWIEELDATIEDKAMRISNAVKKWTLSTAIATPITFSSISMDCDELHNIISLNTDIIDEKMGVVYANIGEYKHMREKTTEEFANKNIDQCFEHIYRYNVTYNNHSKGLPKKLLYGTAFDFNVFEELRRKKVDKYTAWDNVFIEQ